MQQGESPFERLRNACLTAPQAAGEVLPLIDFLEAFPGQGTEEGLVHLVGVTALGMAKASQGGLWHGGKWLFLRGAPPEDPEDPGPGWLRLPWAHLDGMFAHLVIKAQERTTALDMLLSVSAPLLAWRRLESLQSDQNRVLALQLSRLNTLFDLTGHFGMGESESKADAARHLANTLAGEFMIQRVLVLDPQGSVLAAKGLGLVSGPLGDEALQGLIAAKRLSSVEELKDQDRVHGFVHFADSLKGELNDDDWLFLQTLLNITSGHMSALELREARIQSIKLEKDMELARNIQRRILPQRLPEPDGWQCAAASLPYEAVGGDLYDLWVASDAEQGDRLHMLIGDISGKGLPASLMMTQISAFLRVLADRRVGDWGRLARRLNSLMNEVRDRNRYSTLFAASLNPKTGDLRYLNGGHNPPILVPGDGGPARRLCATGPVVGLLPDAEFREGHDEMAPGDVLVAFTDGIVEAQDSAGEELGEERVVAVAQQAQGAPALDVFERILVEAFRHIKESGFRDDVTLVVIKRCSQSHLQTPLVCS